MGKQPAFQFYTGDWLKDPALQACSTATRGIWINLLANMWESNPRGEVHGTVEEIVRLSNSTPRLFKRFLDENIRHNFAEVEQSNGQYIIRNRRMIREESQKIYEREKKRKQRSVPPVVPQMSPTCPDAPSSSSSSSTTYNSSCRDRDGDNDFSNLCQQWQEEIEMQPSPETFRRLKELLDWLAKEIATKGLPLKPAAEIISEEITVLATKFPTQQNIHYFRGMVKGKLEEFNVAEGEE